MKRIAINGYGRIGRCLVRAIYERGLQQDYQVVAINDLAPFDVLAHLTQYDSTHGHFSQNISLQRDKQGDILHIGDWDVALLSEPDASKQPWRSLAVDVVVESSGKLKTGEALSAHLNAGAKKVLATHPVDGADKTVVYGVNHDQLTDSDNIISNASCTTNCLAPVVKVLDDAFGFQQGQMTTIHAYTNDQNLVDKAHGDKYRARAAATSMIPTKTGAAKAVGMVLPHLAGKLDGMAVRVPTLNVSMVDLHCFLAKEVSAQDINDAMIKAAESELKGVLAVNNLPLVSVDFNHHSASSIFDLSQTRVMGQQAKVMSWYDNEWGFSNRLIDVLATI